MIEKKISIKEAVVELENCRKSTVISYVASQNALLGPEDAMPLVDTIEMVAATGKEKLDRLDLFLHSPGGFADAAFKIVKICKEYSTEFNVIVPLAAKSAATVICLGADEIVMTSVSELGPIDPIIQHPYKPEIKVPARSIRDFFEFLSATETADKIPLDQNIKDRMTSLFDPYLIGSYQTALKSSKQIATLLLSEGMLKGKPEEVSKVVDLLTEKYYSHSFVIDRNTAKAAGLKIIFAEQGPNKALLNAIRQLFAVYSNFMQGQKISKVIGNRERNINFTIQPPPPPPVDTKAQSSVNIIF